MARTIRSLLVVVALVGVALAFGTARAQASGGNYVFDGGTAGQQAQVRKALNASAFPWGVVPGPIVIHIDRGGDSEAAPGEIWLDGNLLDAGVFSWGVVQHEYAHQVDFLLFDDATRASLLGRLGGSSWSGQSGSAHSAQGRERFASTLAWAYWPSPQNSMRPQSANDESAAMAPAAFRQLIDQLGIKAPLVLR